MALKHLKVRNFQSLKKIDVELKPFTVIVGPSDSGKSALVRALAACLFNTSGNDYITWGSKECGVSLEGDWGKITYTKGGSSAYKIGDKTYSAIGRGPFTEVEKLGFRELSVEGAKIRPQISTQYDPPFLISDAFSPQIVSSILGVLSDSVKISSAKKLAETDLRATIAELNYKQKDLEQVSSELLSSGQVLDDYEQATLSVFSVWDQRLELFNKVDKLGPLLVRHSKIKTECQELVKQLEKQEQLKPLQEEFNVLLAKAQTQKNMEEKYAIIVRLYAIIERIEKAITWLREKVAECKKKSSELEVQYNSLIVLEKAKKIKAEMQTFQDQIVSYTGQKEHYLSHISNIKVCNECGREL